MTVDEFIDWVDTIHYKENGYYLSTAEPTTFAKEVAIRFGKQCFEAGRECTSYFDEIDKKYDDFEDYLKNLEND